MRERDHKLKNKTLLSDFEFQVSFMVMVSNTSDLFYCFHHWRIWGFDSDLLLIVKEAGLCFNVS